MKGTISQMINESHRISRYGDQPELGTPDFRRQIGKELRTAREFNQMTLEQVVAITRINARYLDDIENGKWSFLAPTYVKAFILSFADAVGVDAKKLSGQLDEIFPSPWALPEPTPSLADWEATPEPGARGLGTGVMGWAESNRQLLFYIVIAAVAVALILFYVLRPIPSPMPPPQPTRTQISSAPESPEEETSGPTGAERIARPEERFTINLVANDTCYVKAAAGDSLHYEHILWPGNRVALEASQPVALTLGNAGAMLIIVNNDTLPPLSSLGRVKTTMIGSQGIIP